VIRESPRNPFNVRTIFKTKRTLRGALRKTGPVRDAQKRKRCLNNIPCDCGRCYIGETSRPLKVRIKEHKYNFAQSLLEKSEFVQHAYKEGHKIRWKEVKVLQIEPNTTYRKYMESAHMSLTDHPISQPSLDIIIKCRLSREICVFYIGTIQKICLFSDDFYSDSTLIVTTAVTLCTDLGARVMCVEFF
jgi:hypothetical protein